MPVTVPHRFRLARPAGTVVGLVAFVCCAAQAAVRIETTPAELVLSGERSRQQLAVSGRGADGSLRDLTPVARFTVEPPDVARVSATGVVFPGKTRSGEALIRVEAGGEVRRG